MGFPKGEWTRTKPIKQKDFFKITNAYVDGKPFKPSYEDEPTSSIQRLLNGDYFRIWKTERDEFLEKRKMKNDQVIEKKRERSKSRTDKRITSKMEAKKVDRNGQCCNGHVKKANMAK